MDLTTTYLGLDLAHPIVPSASPISETVDGIRELEDAGAPAIIMHSLFEEQIAQESHRLDHYLSYFTEAFAEAQTYFPEVDTYHVGPGEYLDKIRRAKEAVDVPVIGSLNGITTGGWVDYARKIEEAGADALELNVYFIPTDPEMTGGEVEQMYIEVVREVKAHLSIPLAVKVGPYFSAIANMAYRLAYSGADGLVLFNRFYQPDFDLENLEVVPHLVLSTPFEMRLPLRWVAMLYGRVEADFAITSGVQTHEDVLKGLMAGAKVMMTASELLRNGTYRIQEMLQALRLWMEEHEYDSVVQMQGSMSQQHVADPASFERANYMKVLQSWRPDPAGEMMHLRH
jgi:dihydroorotate dehydrogenase (fumarate)